mmetsp:Transcript_33147/g.77088  ORF Transcript_33147/g.77088 Transcript_33147/m.77088 type:complete len:205 (-) Transcript_33147:183-797(-)
MPRRSSALRTGLPACGVQQRTRCGGRGLKLMETGDETRNRGDGVEAAGGMSCLRRPGAELARDLAASGSMGPNKLGCTCDATAFVCRLLAERAGRLTATGCVQSTCGTASNACGAGGAGRGEAGTPFEAARSNASGVMGAAAGSMKELGGTLHVAPLRVGLLARFELSTEAPAGDACDAAGAAGEGSAADWRGEQSERAFESAR